MSRVIALVKESQNSSIT